MGQRKSDDPITVDQMLKLVDQLSPEAQEEFRHKFDAKVWGKEWRQIQNEIDSRRITNGLPLLSDDEIITEVKSVRDQRKAQRSLL